MLFNSIEYLVFFPIVLLVYFLIPRKIRYVWLLVTSYYFYMCWNARYALLMLTSTLITYVSGLCIAHFRARGKPGLMKWSVALSFLSNLAILGFFKYGNFIVENTNALLLALGLEKQLGALHVLLPVGISFYTFQALGYTMDIYRGRLPAEKNVLRYALFVSFFPQLVAGPIERSENLLTQLQEPRDFDAENARRGLIRIAYGLLLKVVLADNLARIVNPVYTSYAQYAGIEIVLATFAFAFQIYCDFAGYSLIAIGSAEVFGYRLMENFKSPYLAVSVADFWRRWHISLTSWFKDYLYIPLGGNRLGKARKYVNTMIVFLVSGLWHGANWTFVFWGALNGLMIVLGEMTQGLRARTLRGLGLKAEGFGHTFFRRAVTFLFINLTWVFFRAPTIGAAFDMLGKVFGDLRLPLLFSEGIFAMAQGPRTALISLLFIGLLTWVDALKNRGADVCGAVLSQSGPFRFLVYAGLVLSLFLFGVYGKTFAQTQFIYFQF